MNPYGSARDGYGRDRDLPRRASDPRARSRSPPSRPRAAAPFDRDYHTSAQPRDHDAAAKLLPRKPVTASNSIPVNSSGGHSHAFASTSASSSTLDRNLPTARFSLPERPELSTSAPRKPSSAAAEPSADLLTRLTASQPERKLFDQIEDLRFTVTELRRDHGEQRKKLKTFQDYVNKTANKDPKATTKLNEQQQSVLALEQHISRQLDALYSLQVQWEVAVSNHAISAATAPLESKIDELRKEARSWRAEVRQEIKSSRDDLRKEIKSESADDNKRLDEIDKQQRMNSGQVNRMQGDIVKIKHELQTHTKDVQRLRQDLDKDAFQITDNHNRLKALEKASASVPAKPSSSTIGHSAATPTVQPTLAAATSSWSRSASPVQDPRTRPAPRPTTTDAAAASGATSNSVQASPAQSTHTEPTPAPGSKPVTQAQFRKWERDLKQDLELRFEEIKELAVEEATDENKSCMETRLRMLARKWKQKVTNGEHASEQQTQVGASAAAAFGNASSSNVAASGNESAPMDIDPAANVNKAQSTHSAGTSIKHAGPSPTQLRPDSDVIELVSPPNSASQTGAAQPTPKTASTSSETPPMAKLPPAEPDAVKAAVVAMLAEAHRGIHATLKQHETHISGVKQELDHLLSMDSKASDKFFHALCTKLQDEFFDKLLEHFLSSQDHLKRLFVALRSKSGLAEYFDTISAAVRKLHSDNATMQTEVAGLRDLGARVGALGEWRLEFTASVTDKLGSLQRQLDVMDDQSSLQGALIVKLCEHANPRRPAPAATAAGGSQVQSPVVRSPLVQQAQAQHQAHHSQQQHQHQHQHQHQNQNQHQHRQQQQLVSPTVASRPPSTLDVAAAALSPNLQQHGFTHRPPQALPQQLQQQMHQLQQAAQQQPQQPQQQTGYVVPRAPYPYQDPNPHQGYP
ncbi:uncharacterized protein UTRI_05203_B [Ustilago trichophora]|uniref:Uncharacterized protein n=1 Tax=Ustilago trichophora TaxID=86804 RepID=A0A5C3EM22_9BASI|nr:uncharacterized protein UTRI_05203_B [Ustilago trichophora]